jgi:carbamoyltransferase
MLAARSVRRCSPGTSSSNASGRQCPRIGNMALNTKIKLRERFRPFAPCVLREHAHRIFDLPEHTESPYMALVTTVRSPYRVQPAEAPADPCQGQDLSARLQLVRSSFPAITHVDYSARIQTVDAERHGRFRRLLAHFEARTGCPLLVNTSFNVRGEPIVRTPAEAYACFRHTDMDVLVLEDYVLMKKDQAPFTDRAHEPPRQALELD